MREVGIGIAARDSNAMTENVLPVVDVDGNVLEGVFLSIGLSTGTTAGGVAT
jgi:hypothetical protein